MLKLKPTSQAVHDIKIFKRRNHRCFQLGCRYRQPAPPYLDDNRHRRAGGRQLSGQHDARQLKAEHVRSRLARSHGNVVETLRPVLREREVNHVCAHDFAGDGGDHAEGVAVHPGGRVALRVPAHVLREDPRRYGLPGHGFARERQRRVLGPGRHRSPHHRMPSTSGHAGSNMR